MDIKKNKNFMVHMLQGMLAMLNSESYEEMYEDPTLVTTIKEVLYSLSTEQLQDVIDYVFTYEGAEALGDINSLSFLCDSLSEMSYLGLEDLYNFLSITKNKEDLLESPDSNTQQIVKQLDEEEMIAIEPLYINVGGVDAHGDGITDTQLNILIENFNNNIANIQGNIHHTYMTEGFKPLKAYRMPMDVYIGNPLIPSDMKLIPEGQPVVKVQFTKNEVGYDLWEKRKEGILRGVSIGAIGRRVPNPDYIGDSE